MNGLLLFILGVGIGTYNAEIIREKVPALKQGDAND